MHLNYIVKLLGICAPIAVLSSCKTIATQITEDALVSIGEAVTGVEAGQLYDSDEKSINVGNIVKANKQRKINKKKEIIENY